MIDNIICRRKKRYGIKEKDTERGRNRDRDTETEKETQKQRGTKRHRI